MQSVEFRTSIPISIKRNANKYGTLIALIVMVVVFGLLKPGYFLSVKNLLNIIQQVALFGLVAIGLTFPLAMKNFDLSVGYIASLAGIVVIKMFEWGFSEFGAIFGTLLLVGGLCGLLNGGIVSAMRVQSLVATIGTGFLFFGVTMLITGGARLFYEIPPHFQMWGILPASLFILFGVLVITYIVLQRTGIGRFIYAIGNNENASMIAGVNTRRVKLFSFIMCDIFAALAGIMLSSQVMCGDPVGANRYLMQGLAAAYIGTGIFRKGEANIFGTIIGILIIGVAYNGMTLIGVHYALREAFTGMILIAALVTSGRE